MISNDKIGQIPAKFDIVIDNIFKVVCGINVHKGKNISYCNMRPNTNPTYKRKSISGAPLCYSMLHDYYYQKFCPRTI